MQSMWSITIEDFLIVCDMAKANGVKPGESMDKEFKYYMKSKGKKPIGHTELSKKEFITEYLSHNKSVLDIKVNSKGKQEIIIYKNKPNLDK